MDNIHWNTCGQGDAVNNVGFDGSAQQRARGVGHPHLRTRQGGGVVTTKFKVRMDKCISGFGQGATLPAGTPSCRRNQWHPSQPAAPKPVILFVPQRT